VPEAGRHIDGAGEGQGNHRPDAWNRHQAPAGAVILDDRQYLPMEAGHLLPQRLSGSEQGGRDVRQFRPAVHKFPDLRVKSDRPDHADLETKVAQQTADVVLDRDHFFLLQLAGGQQSPTLLACHNLDMHRPEQVDPHHLSNASGIIAIDLIHLMADLISGLSQQIRKIEIELMKWHRADAVCQRLEAIPGIEFITATALAATVNDARAFRSGC
jgi:hypothetical protein